MRDFKRFHLSVLWRWWRSIRLGKWLVLCCYFTFLLFSWPGSEVKAQTETPPPPDTPTPTYQPVFPTYTPLPTEGMDCPEGRQPLGAGTVTPNPYWSANCAQCITPEWAIETSTLWPTSTAMPTATATVSPTATSTPISYYVSARYKLDGGSDQILYQGWNNINFGPATSHELQVTLADIRSNWSAYLIIVTEATGVKAANSQHYDRITATKSTSVTGYAYGMYDLFGLAWDWLYGVGSWFDDYRNYMAPGEFDVPFNYTLWNGFYFHVSNNGGYPGKNLIWYQRPYNSPTWGGNISGRFRVYLQLWPDAGPTATPSPTMTPYATATYPASFCSEVEGEEGQGETEDYFALPAPTFGSSTCYGIDSITIPLSWLGFDDVYIPGVEVCFKPIYFGILKMFGLNIDLDYIAYVLAGVAILRMILRS